MENKDEKDRLRILLLKIEVIPSTILIGWLKVQQHTISIIRHMVTWKP